MQTAILMEWILLAGSPARGSVEEPARQRRVGVERPQAVVEAQGRHHARPPLRCRTTALGLGVLIDVDLVERGLRSSRTRWRAGSPGTRRS